jgi:hypothetical protein
MQISRFLSRTGFLLALGLMFFPEMTRAKDFPHPNAIMFLPTGLASSSYIFEYERGLGDYWGLALRGTGTSHWLWQGGKTGADDDYDWIYTLKGAGAGLSARIYPWGNAPQGYFVGPRVDFLKFQGTYEDRAKNRPQEDIELQVTTLHLETGFKFLIAERFILSPFVDAGVPLVKGSDSGAELAMVVSFIVGGGIYVGWVF